MDGTMFDTERLRIRMLKQASKEIYGEEISDDLLYESLGISAVTAEKLAKQRYSDEYPYKKIRAHADELERAYVRKNGLPVKAGLYNLLERLKKNGVLIALATSSRREIAEEYLVNAKVRRFFDIVVCGEEVAKGKPDPEIFLKTARQLNCDPGSCLIFEDSQNGLLAASAAGGLTIFIKDIKDPAPEVKALAFRSYEKMTDFLEEFAGQMAKMPIPTLNERFPQSFDSTIVGIHGFGAMGGGYLAQVFSHWDGYTRPNQIIGTTTNKFIRNLVNTVGKYSVKYDSLAYFQTIKNVTLIDMNDEAQVIEMYKKAKIVGVALPESAIKSQSETIAKGLVERFNAGGEYATLVIVMNKINSAKFVRNHVEAYVKLLVCEEKAKKVLERTFFSETVVNRMVSKIPDNVILSNIHNDLYGMRNTILESSEKMQNLAKFYETYLSANTPVKQKKFAQAENKASVQSIGVESALATARFANELSKLFVTLFSSESDMTLFANKGSPILERLRQVVTVENIRSMQEIKNKLLNGTHAIVAWYSALLGYKTIGQGMGDLRVLSLAENIMRNEIKPALLIENPNSKQYINSILSSFIKRCRTSFKDKCTRVGRDPLRKLQRGERIIGAIKLAQKYGSETRGLEFGVACAIMYSILPINDNNVEALKIKEVYEKRFSVSDVLTYDGEYNKLKFGGLDTNKDSALIARIEESFEKLQKELTSNQEDTRIQLLVKQMIQEKPI